MKGDLVGKTINELTILEEFSKNKKTYCKVKCSCGKVFETRKDSIVANKTKSCGHLTQFKSKDIAGRRFGRLVAIEPLRIENTSYTWLCKCDCGRTIEAKIGNLTSGKTKSCGCFKSDFRSEDMKILHKSMKGTEYVEGTFIPALNKTIAKNNKSGIKGVSWDKTRFKWVAQIQFKGKTIFLGRFDKLEDAIIAREEAEEKYFEPILEKYKKD